MAMKQRTKTRNLALSAILVALGTVFLYFGSIITVLDLTMVAMAAMIIFFTVIELGGFYPYLVYVATSALALLLLPDKNAALYYCLFGGIYPVFKSLFEKSGQILSWILKFLFFNAILTLIIVITLYVIGAENADLGFEIVVYLAGNLFFFVYDIAMTRLITAYLFKFRRMLRIDKYFKNK